MWKPPASVPIINSAQAATFHHSALLSTRRPVEAMLEIRTTGARRKPAAQGSGIGPLIRLGFLKPRKGRSAMRARFGDKCPLFQSIYYCF